MLFIVELSVIFFSTLIFSTLNTTLNSTLDTLLSTTQFIIYVLIDRVADISYVHKVGRLDDFFDEFQNFKKIICGTKTIKSIDYS